MIEGWVAGAVITGVATVAGAAISSAAQSSAAKTAANAQMSAAQLQANTQASTANAQLGIEAPTRALGGLAQQQLAYELGLSPNLDISSSFMTPQVNVDGTTTWVNGSGANASGGTPGTVGSNPVGGNAITGADGQQYQMNPDGTQATSVTGNPIPVAAGTVQGVNGSSGPNTNEGAYGSLMQNPFQNPSNLSLSPAYQFDLSAGLAAVNNQSVAAGHSQVGTGGFDAATEFAQGNALNAYQTAFQNAQSQQTMNYNELAATAGEAQIGNASSNSALESSGAGISAAQGAAGNAAAAGAIGQGNAITSGIGTGLSSISSYLGQNNSGKFSGSSGGNAGTGVTEAGGGGYGYDAQGNGGYYNDAGQLIGTD